MTVSDTVSSRKRLEVIIMLRSRGCLLCSYLRHPRCEIHWLVIRDGKHRIPLLPRNIQRYTSQVKCFSAGKTKISYVLRTQTTLHPCTTIIVLSCKYYAKDVCCVVHLVVSAAVAPACTTGTAVVAEAATIQQPQLWC